MEIMQTKLQEEVEKLQAVQKQGWVVLIWNYSVCEILLIEYKTSTTCRPNGYAKGNKSPWFWFRLDEAYDMIKSNYPVGKGC